MVKWYDPLKVRFPKDREFLVMGEGIYDFGPVVVALPEDSMIGPREIDINQGVVGASYDEEEDVWYSMGLAFVEDGRPAAGVDMDQHVEDIQGRLIRWRDMPPSPDSGQHPPDTGETR